MSSPLRDFQTTDMSEFQNELDRKDLIIKNLQNQLYNMKSQGGGVPPSGILSDLKLECMRKDKEIQILNSKIFELSSDLKEANAKLNCYELKENFNKNESGSLLEISEMKIDKISQEKKMLEEKINQLVDIIRQYCNELNDSSLKIKNLNKELLEYKMDYNNELNKNKSLNEKIMTLVSRCNEYEQIQKTFKDASNDLQVAKKQINEINLRNQENEQFINTLYNDINDNIELFVKYINKNFGLNKNNNENSISNNNFNIKKNLKKIEEINFESLLDILELKKKEIIDFSNVISTGLEASDRENKILIEENSKLKEEINSIIFENKKLNSENIKLNNIINEINTDMITSKKNEEILKQKLNDINDEKDEINNKLFNELNQNKNIFEKLKEDNTNLFLMNNNLNEELQIMKNREFQNEQENNNLQLNCQILEKKIKGLQTELDLKNIQIQNQEEIINRRNDNNNSNIIENDSVIIKQLKSDRDNLINDNVLLINQNNILRQKLNGLNNGQENLENIEYNNVENEEVNEQ